MGQQINFVIMSITMMIWNSRIVPPEADSGSAVKNIWWIRSEKLLKVNWDQCWDWDWSQCVMINISDIWYIWSGCCLYCGVSYHPLWLNRLQGDFGLYVEAGCSILILALYMYNSNILCEKISSLISSRSLLFKQIFRSAIRKQKAPNGFLTPLEETLRWSFVRFYILHAIHDLIPKGELRLRCYSYNLWDTPSKRKIKIQNPRSICFSWCHITYHIPHIVYILIIPPTLC